MSLPYLTLKAAVDNSADGDTIYLFPGLYVDNDQINIENKNISIYLSAGTEYRVTGFSINNSTLSVVGADKNKSLIVSNTEIVEALRFFNIRGGQLNLSNLRLVDDRQILSDATDSTISFNGSNSSLDGKLNISNCLVTSDNRNIITLKQGIVFSGKIDNSVLVSGKTDQYCIINTEDNQVEMPGTPIDVPNGTWYIKDTDFICSGVINDYLASIQTNTQGLTASGIFSIKNVSIYTKDTGLHSWRDYGTSGSNILQVIGATGSFIGNAKEEVNSVGGVFEYPLGVTYLKNTNFIQLPLNY